MSFGKYAIVDNLKFNLDKEPDWWWEVHPPTISDEIALNRFLFVERAADPPNVFEGAMKELELTFAGTNIPDYEELGGDLRKLFEAMPTELLMEIWQKMGEAVPNWGPPKPPEKEPEEGGDPN